MDIDKITRQYAGDDYADPQKIAVGKINLFDIGFDGMDELIAMLTAFRDKHAACEIDGGFSRGWGDDSPEAIITAWRMETSEEAAIRAEQTRQAAIRSFEEGKRTALYYAAKYLQGNE